METDNSFHALLSYHLRPYRIIIKNLHYSTLCTNIFAALLEKLNYAKQVINVKQKQM